MYLKIILFCRRNCLNSKKLINFLKNNSNLKVIYDDSKKQNFFSKKVDLIICFRSKIILKKKILNKSKFSINFHPGTPKYRGIGSTNFALMNNEKYYGTTCHIINQKIDSGKILDVVYFKILNLNIEDVLIKTHDKMLKQAIRICNRILKHNNYTNYIQKLINKYDGEKWSKKIYYKKDLEKLYIINLKNKKKEIDKVIKSTNLKNYKPYINLYGHKFFYEKK